MAIIKKFASFQNLSNYQTFLIDSNPNSSYFRITEFKETFTGGKNGFLIEGSEYLKETTEVKIEILDVEGNPIYFEPGEGIPEYYEGVSKLVSVHVYDDTPIGLGKITILGELKEYVDSNGVTRPIPEEWKGVYNVKWEKEFKINKNLSNEDIVRFYKRPIIQIEELVKPIFSKSVNTVTENVSVSGIPQIPIGGTNLSTWRAGTSYKLIRTSGSWDRDVDENPITVSLDDGTTYTPNIIEVLNDRELLVDTPYTLNNLVSGFLSQSAAVTYQDFKNEQIAETVLTGSFAKIDMYQLKTFVGDVARVKIFRKSRNQVNDFQLVQESKLESTELLRDVTTTSNTEVPYGKFDDTNFNTYWETSSVDHPVTVDSSKLSQAIKIDYSGTGVQKIITKESFNISKDVEYTLSFKTLLDGVLTDGKYINAYFSGSYTNNLGNSASYIQSFMYISGSDIYKTRQNVSQNIIAERDINAKLVLEVSGDDWYISNVSLRNAQETSFSPDEFTLIQDIPRKVAIETFDFRFEFYDINNNYIPVEVLASATFDGGNDFPTNTKLLTFESDRNAFRFSTGSLGNPSYQQIQFKTTTSNLTGSVLFTSQAFDIEGNFISSQSYYESGAAVYGTPFTGSYPGLLTSVTNAGALVSIASFSGSLDTGTTPDLNRIRIGSIVYTASIENVQEFETVYRLEDGDNAPQLIVTSNANQFVYEPTTLSPKPSGQSITVRAQRKNLASLITPLEINSGSNLPPLNFVSTTNGIDTYTISALQFSASFAANNFDEVTYSFTGSDVFGNQQSDEITLSKVVNFDAVSFRLSNPTHTFTADSTGVVTADFSTGNGSVTMFVAGNQIQFDDNGARNTFEITNLQGTGCTPIGGNGFDPTTNQYGITAMSLDSASLDVTITYTAGDNSTTQSFTENVTYTKARIAAPVISIETTNKDQSVSAFSTGEQVDSFENCIVTVKEQYGGSTTTKTITSLSATSSDISSISTTPSTGTITLNGKTLANGTNKTTIAVSATVTDSEGTSRTVTDTISLSKVKKAQPSITFAANPDSQTVTATSTGTLLGTIQDVTISGFEGSTALTYNQGTLSDGQYKITNVTGVTVADTTPSTSTIDITTFSGDEVTGTATIAYVDSEGTSGTATKQFSLSKAKKAPPGVVGTLNPQAQTVESNTAFTSVGTPQTITLSVNEGGSEYSYQSGVTIGEEEFKITSVTGGTFNTTTGLITPTTPSDETGTSGVVTYSYTNSEGTTFTGKTINFNVGVSIQGEPWVGAFSIEVNPPSQEVIIDIQDSITTPDSFDVQVFDGEGTYTYSSTLASNATFKVTNLSQTNRLSGLPSNSSGTITPVTPANANGSNVTFDVTVKDRAGTTSSAVSKTHKIRVVADGSTGPGIVFTGVWDTNRIYQYDLSNGRRDAVLWSTNGNPPYDTYYATLQQAPADIDSPDITTGSYWEYLGEEDFFVAAKIAIFEESFIKNTLNVGSNNDGALSAANITLWGADNYPYFSLGQSATVGTQEFGANGIFIGRHTTAKNTDATNGSYVLSLVNGTDSWLKWDGDSLDIKGSITFTNQGSTDLSGFAGYNGLSGSIYDAQTDANSAQTSANNAQSTANTNLDYLQDIIDGVSILGGGTYIDGNIVYAPVIAGTDGYFSDTFRVGNNGITLDGGATSNRKRIYIGTGTYGNANTPFYVGNSESTSDTVFSLGNKLTFDNSGNLTISGTVNATGGQFSNNITVGGTLTANGMKFGTGVTTGKNGIYIDSNDYWYDDGNFSLGNGNITWNGTTLTVTGDITVTNPGDFAPPDAEPNDPNQDNPTAYSFGPAGGPGFDLNDVTPGTTAGLYLGASNLGYHDGSVWSSYLDNSGNFYLGGTSGALTFNASTGDLSVTGEISADSGDIGGITIASGKIYTGTGTWGATNTGFYVGSDGKFSLKDKLKWDGTTLNINGQGTFSGTVQAGDVTIGPDVGGSGIDGVKIDDYNYWYNAGDIQFRVGDATSRFVYDSDLGIAVISDSTYGGFKIYGEESGSPINKTSMNYRYFEVSPAVESNTSTNWGYFSTGGMTMKCNSIAQRNYFDLSLGHDLYISGGPLIVGDDITATGNITAFGSSDKRLKDNIVPISNALEKIIKIGGYEFDWNENQKTYEGHDVGVIAQEVQEVLPEVVQEKEDGYLGVRYEKIVPLLIEGIKELVDKVESLEQEILKLKEKK